LKLTKTLIIQKLLKELKLKNNGGYLIKPVRETFSLSRGCLLEFDFEYDTIEISYGENYINLKATDFKKVLAKINKIMEDN